MTYVWLKALHVAAVLVWIGGLFTQSIVLASLVRGDSERRATALIAAVRRWDSLVTSPALLLVWGLGLTLALLSESFGAGWLTLKLAIVTALSGLHGIQAGLLRRSFVDAGAQPPGFVRWSPPLVTLAVLAIAILVIIRPL